MDIITEINHRLKKENFKFNIYTQNKHIRIELNSLLAKGNEATVYNISETNISHLQNKKIILKVIVSKQKNNLLKHFLNNFNHVNIEKIFLIYQTPQFSLVLCEKLDRVLSDFEFSKKEEIYYVTSEIINALVYLHTICNIAHCDIKENNIMYSYTSGRFKLIDFNNSSHLSEFKKFEVQVNIYRRSLKVIKNEYNWGYDIDIWALGATIYNLCFKKEILTESLISIELLDTDQLDKRVKNKLIEFYEKKILFLKDKKSIFYYFFTLNDIKIMQNLFNYYIANKKLN